VTDQRRIARYGWKPSLPDFRDLRADTAGLAVASEVDPREDMPPVFDQGNLGSCTANAVAAALLYDRYLDGHPRASHPSRLFIYYCERLLEGSLDQGDVGAYGRDGFKAAQRYGVPTEHDWEYDVGRFSERPPSQVWDHAAKHKLLKDYRAVRRSTTEFKKVLTNRQTVAFGFSVFQSFESYQVAETGMVPLPVPGEAMLGGHEVLLVGYLRDYPLHALCRNSWGEDWGRGGYFLMPWAYLLDTGLSDDFRTIRRPA
jgi:C1A family cysteine protease